MDDNKELSLEAAELALYQGEYTFCLKILRNLAKTKTTSGREQAQIKLLLINLLIV